MSEEHDPLAEFRQPYRTLSERAEDRKAQAQARHRAEQSRPSTDGPTGAPEPNYKLWRCTDGQRTAYVKCPSKSGAKIYLCAQHGWGNRNIYAEMVDEFPVDEYPKYTATFPTVLEANADLGYNRSK